MSHANQVASRYPKCAARFRAASLQVGPGYPQDLQLSSRQYLSSERKKNALEGGLYDYVLLRPLLPQMLPSSHSTTKSSGISPTRRAGPKMFSEIKNRPGNDLFPLLLKEPSLEHCGFLAVAIKGICCLKPQTPF